jgi:hypothetical protein
MNIKGRQSTSGGSISSLQTSFMSIRLLKEPVGFFEKRELVRIPRTSKRDRRDKGIGYTGLAGSIGTRNVKSSSSTTTRKRTQSSRNVHESLAGEKTSLTRPGILD